MNRLDEILDGVLSHAHPLTIRIGSDRHWIGPTLEEVELVGFGHLPSMAGGRSRVVRTLGKLIPAIVSELHRPLVSASISTYGRRSVA